jgi:hypothetical protein
MFECAALRVSCRAAQPSLALKPAQDFAPFGQMDIKTVTNTPGRHVAAVIQDHTGCSGYRCSVYARSHSMLLRRLIANKYRHKKLTDKPIQYIPGYGFYVIT